MSLCSRCGNPVEFRYIGGQCIPLHLHGGCGSSSSAVVDFSGHSVCQESSCFQTKCPVCQEAVFFVRHNGGSVWLDAPLGPPWQKHGCFDVHTPASRARSLAAEYQVDFRDSTARAEGTDERLALGVIRSTRVEFSRHSTEVTMESGETLTYVLTVKHNAGFLLSKLCLLDEAAMVIYPLEAATFKFAVLAIRRVERVHCEHCGVLVGLLKLPRHMKKVHGVRTTT